MGNLLEHLGAKPLAEFHRPLLMAERAEVHVSFIIKEVLPMQTLIFGRVMAATV
jgi:hypothetical protein